MKKRSTGSDLRQVVVEQPKMVQKQLEIEEHILAKQEEQKSNKSSILDARGRDDGVRRRGGGSIMMDEIDDILREDGGGSLMEGNGKGEEAVEATIEFGREGVWWGCCCGDLNRWSCSKYLNQVCFSHSLKCLGPGPRCGGQ